MWSIRQLHFYWWLSHAASTNGQVIRTFSQSADPESQYFAEHTTLLSKNAWRSLLFTARDIQDDPHRRSMK